MAEYIDREQAEIMAVDGADRWARDENLERELAIQEAIRRIPTADVVEVKHGYWIDKPTGRYCHMGSWCSVCQEKSGIGGIESNRHKPYCPNCGAKMGGRSNT